MMSRLIKQIVYTCLMFLCLPAAADTLTLSNGDKISGKIKYLDQEVLVIKTPYASIQLDWTKVKAIKTKKPMTIVTRSGDVVHGKLASEGALYHVKQDDGEVIEFAALNGISQFYPKEDKEKPWRFSGKTYAFLELKDGNTESEELNFDADLSFVHGVHRHNVGLETDRTTKKEHVVEDKLQADYSYDYFYNQHWYFTTNLGYEEDGIKELNERLSAGIGLGYEFFNTPLHHLSVEGGINHIREKYRDEGVKEFEVFRWALDYSKEMVFFDKLSFFHNHEMFIPKESSKNFRFESETGFEYSLPYNISTVLQYEYDYDNYPAEGKHKKDSTFSFGVGYKW
ncbi:DUF481 domain-containing protein [Spartinivicinus ruber]|uniref:DUF481 domain-containing protein n=1 Tax=Spartinivicinus ruber TaxID=2683272 RepID=UPI0013D29E5E|nr:DUF481 domain-containing protein [Spartinivicinus ruber]